MPLAGGAPREILENVEDADWSPDGANLAVTRQVGNRGRVEYPLGKVLFDAAGWVSNVRVSPDGRLVAFVDHPQHGDNDGNFRVVDTNGKVRLERPLRHRRDRLVAAGRRDLVERGLRQRRHRDDALGKESARLDCAPRRAPPISPATAARSCR